MSRAYIIISQENAFIFATYFHYNLKPGPDKYFCFVTTKNVFVIAITPEEFACSLLVAEGKSMQ